MLVLFGLIFSLTGCDGFFDVIDPKYQGKFDWTLNGTEGTIIAVIDGNSVTISGDSAGIDTGTVRLGRHSISSARVERVIGLGGASDSTSYVLYSSRNNRFASFSGENPARFFIWGFDGSFWRIE